MLPKNVAETLTGQLNVSRETLERLKALEALLTKWNARINLVSKTTIADIWMRHIVDSAQVLPHLPSTDITLVDMGSGAGFPGLILSILGVRHVHLVESDARKCAFLVEASRLSANPIQIHTSRMEALAPFPCDVITARALAPLSHLLSLAEAFLHEGALCFFLKGVSITSELQEATKHWRFTHTLSPSLTSPEGCVVKLCDIHSRTAT